MKLRPSLVAFAMLVLTCAGDDSAPKAVAKEPSSSATSPSPESAPTPSRPGFPPGVPEPPPRPNSWLGLSIAKPQPSVVAQIPSLPEGIGFVVESVLPGGPAEAAQLRALDVVWKFGDQLLANQAQLATLLNLKRPGDEVKLAVFRAGQPLEVTLKLGEAPANREPFPPRRMFEDDSLCETKIVIPGERTATYSTDKGKAVLKREGEIYRLTITDPEQKVLFDGPLPGDGNLDKIPDGWHRRVWVLRRSLDHAMANQIVPVMPPRPRVLPAPEPAPAPPKAASDH
jgi:hypothetical protein